MIYFHGGGPQTPLYYNVVKGNGDGTFLGSGTNVYVANRSTGSIKAVGDYNGDGKIDLLYRFFSQIYFSSNSYFSEIYIGNGDGTFQNERLLEKLLLRYGYPDTYTYENIGPVTADFNKDGNSDQAALHPQGGISLSLGKSDGTHESPVYIAGGAYRFILATDLNGDGWTDLLLQGADLLSFAAYLNQNGPAPLSKIHDASLDEDTPTTITLPTPPSAPSGAQLTYGLTLAPVKGTLGAFNGNQVTYTPAPNSHGPDSFSYRVANGSSTVDVGTVSLSVVPVNDAPVATDLSAATAEDTPIPLTLSATDIDGDPLTYPIVEPPRHGTLTGVAPALTYTPAKDYHGPDSFTYRANDGKADSNTAAVTLTVTPDNDAPLAQAQSVNLDEDTPKEIVLAGTDVESDPLTFSVVAPPRHGTLSGTPPNLTYTPAPNYHGPDRFTFQARDGQLDSNTAAVSITVTPVNDAPVVQDLSLTSFRDRPLPVSLSGSDLDGDPLAFTVVSPPSHGTLSGAPPTLTYTPEPGYAGSDVFTFNASDGKLDSAPASVRLTVLLPRLTLSDATAEPGGAALLTLALSEASTGVAGLDLRLRAVGPDGLPAPAPSFSLAPATSDWNLAVDPNDPWHVSLASAHPISGPVEALRLRLTAPPSAPVGTAYRIEAVKAVVSDARGREEEVTGLVAPGWLNVQRCAERVKGDVTGEGVVDVRDAIFVLRVTVDLEAPANGCVIAAADVNCTGTVTIGDAVLILRHIVMGEPFPCSGP
ncbi:MAG: tandem-95 repeat protein [Armatimonadetes bacterium]|nr:tandem-95 repeat protein [Armatimonadota bacterium]